MGPKQKFGLGAGSLLVMALVGAAVWLHAIPRQPKYAALEIGKPMTLMPVTAQTLQPLSTVTTAIAPKGVHLTIHWQGASIAVEHPAAAIKFYRGQDTAAFYATTWSELKQAYHSSGCTNNQIGSLDGPLDAVLICDGRLGNLALLSKIEVYAPDRKKTKYATAFAAYQRSDDVLSVMVQVY
jgi:hypothetical protein